MKIPKLLFPGPENKNKTIKLKSSTNIGTPNNHRRLKLSHNIKPSWRFKIAMCYDSLMSLPIQSDGRGRSGSGETWARPKVTDQMTEIHAINTTSMKKLSIFILLNIFLFFFIYFIETFLTWCIHENFITLSTVELFIVMNANAD